MSLVVPHLGLYANLNGQQLNVGFNDPYQQQTAYGQQASSSTGAGGSGFVVRNPNSQFVPQLRSLMNDVQSGKTIDFNGRITASGTGSGTLGSTADSSQVHSNKDVNHRNYQKIQSRSGTGGSQGQQFTNNIYGYDYRSNPDMKYTINGRQLSGTGDEGSAQRYTCFTEVYGKALQETKHNTNLLSTVGTSRRRAPHSAASGVKRLTKRITDGHLSPVLPIRTRTPRSNVTTPSCSSHSSTAHQ